MNSRSLSVPVWTVLGMLLVSTIALAEARPVRRFAVVAGANDGGPGRTQLRFAVADAEGFAGVLQGLGGVRGEDASLLVDPGVESLRGALALVRTRVTAAKANGERSELVLYYSGHSDETGLLLGGEKLEYRELRQFMQDVPADVRVAILDSCASGAVTREKGGSHGPGFLPDASMRVEGQAYLTSSADSEVSQESELVGGSFFTHFLVTGLRGAADVTGDARVTLSEAYRFAYDETLARTLRTRSGPQHPSFEMQLVGTGDFVLTDLRQPDARLVLPPLPGGRWFVRDDAGRLVAEVNGRVSEGPELALKAGAFVVAREANGTLAEQSVALRKGVRWVVDPLVFVAVSRDGTTSRGDESRPLVYAQASVFPPISTYAGPPARHLATIGLVGTHAGALSGIGFSIGGHWTDGDVQGAQLAGAAAISGRDVRGLQLSPVVSVANGNVFGAQLGGVAVSRGDVTGAQVAPVVAIAKDVHGAQVGGLTMARDVWGGQLGVVNVARRVRGLQLGLVNISDQHGGVPIGLVNWVKEGRANLEAFLDSSMPLNLAWRGGARHASTVFFAGADGTDLEKWRIGTGLGFHALWGSLGLDVDALVWSVKPLMAPLAWNVGGTLRASLAWQVTDWLAVTGGPSANVAVGRAATQLGCCSPRATWDDGAGAVWAGWQLGVRVGPVGVAPEER